MKQHHPLREYNIYTYFQERKNEERANTWRMRWRGWLHNNLCGKVWVIFLGTYTCSQFCRHKLEREAKATD